MNTMSIIVDDIYQRLKVFSNGVISGTVYKHKRLKDGNMEDIVVQCAGNRTTKFQQFNYLFVRVYVPDLTIGKNTVANTGRFPILEQFLLDFSNVLHSCDSYVVDLSTRQIETLQGEAYSTQEATPFHMIVLTLQIKNLLK